MRSCILSARQSTVNRLISNHRIEGVAGEGLLIEAAQHKSQFVVRNLISMVGDHDVWAGLPENDSETLLERIYRLRPEHVEVILELIKSNFSN